MSRNSNPSINSPASTNHELDTLIGDKPSSPTSTKKTTRFRGLNIAWKRTGFTNASPPSKGGWTSAKNCRAATTSSHAAPTLIDTAGVDQGVLPEERVMLPPEQAAELLPWYMQWSRDLAAEMHLRRLVGDKARRTNTLPISYRPCDCSADWRCEPHDACFIHDSCFCPGSGSFPPVKPPRS